MTLSDRIRRIQERLKIAADGRMGPQTIGAIEAALGIGGMGNATGSGAVKKLDSRSEKVIATLLPAVQSVFRKLGSEAKLIAKNHGVEFKWIGGTRTYAEQNALYDQGRTKPGRRVTNARGGYSNHNFGVAADAGLFRGSTYIDAADPGLAERIYKDIAAKAAKLDIEWGGNWKSFKDTPHFQFSTGLTTAQMRARVAAGKPIV